MRTFYLVTWLVFVLFVSYLSVTKTLGGDFTESLEAYVGGDKRLHFATAFIFCNLSIALFQRLGFRLRQVMAMVVMVLLFDEAVQAVLPNRHYDFLDLFAGYGGAITAGIGWMFVGVRTG